jgi:hypothetical protein
MATWIVLISWCYALSQWKKGKRDGFVIII